MNTLLKAACKRFFSSRPYSALEKEVFVEMKKLANRIDYLETYLKITNIKLDQLRNLTPIDKGRTPPKGAPNPI